MAKLKKKQNPDGLALSGREISDVLSEYAELNEKIKFLEKRKKELSENLKDLALHIGKQDEKGSFYYTEGDKVFGRVRKCSFSIDEDLATEFFKDRGIYENVTKTVIDKDKIDQLVDSGELNAEDVGKITKIKESFAFYLGDVPKEKEEVTEEMPEVQVTKRSSLKKVRRD